jgi:hypothetical protein
MADTFTDYKGVTKSLNPAVNVPCRVQVLIKTTPPLKTTFKEGESKSTERCF